ncbi:ankyrin repeat-containing domain protein [Stachybotrys elegans]|uniref:Ankyrin repeat-containing domain protein n=1 Tax=Stachybotrys elegans TaxID=80388 RepID=A0A8K0SRN4_9HYPO|nr:ankyrin repeat-containing domain protein [Stachybotrys elegans]
MTSDNDDETCDTTRQDANPTSALNPSAPSQDRIAALHKWLQPTGYLSPGNEYMKHLHSHAAGTDKWIQKAPVFSNWAGDTSSKPCLHVRGVAGSGKSVFAASTIRQLVDAGHVVLFFFFRQIVDKNHAAKYLVRDFASQLLPHCPALAKGLDALMEEHGVDGYETDKVWKLLFKALAEDGIKGTVYCVVDALDEMDDADFEGTVRMLTTLGTARVKVMMTSRPLPKIEQALNHPSVAHLRLDTTVLSPDVARYVDVRMAALEPPLSDEKRRLVKEAICKHASGLFLHARLITDNLAEGLAKGHITEETLPTSLDGLPRSLRDVYEDMLKEHSRRSQVTTEQQAKLLMCVTHASRPLRVIELASLLAHMLGLPLRQGKELVRAGCGRLLEILQDESVSVIHHSFTEFLHDSHRKDCDGAFPVLEDAHCHATLALLSMEYLGGCGQVPEYTAYDTDTASEKIRIRCPLASYAADNLLFHISRAAAVPHGDVLTAVEEMKPGSYAFENWALLSGRGPLPGGSNILHAIMKLSCKHPVPMSLLEHLHAKLPELLDASDDGGRTPLSYASEGGYTDVARFLIHNGADTTSWEKERGWTPLHYAVTHGRPAIVRLLLDAGVDPFIKTHPIYIECNYYYNCNMSPEENAEAQRVTALHYAFQMRNAEVTAMFMPFLPPDQINYYYHEATNVESLQALLATGKVDMECTRFGETKLFKACRSWDSSMVKLLLEHGADPNRQCVGPGGGLYDDNGCALFDEAASAEGGPAPIHGIVYLEGRTPAMAEDREEIAECVRLLVEAGADINATMNGGYQGSGRTALHDAVRKADDDSWTDWGEIDETEEILAEVLLQAGADANAKTPAGFAPIHLANPQKPRLLDILMSYGADTNVINAEGRTPLLEILHSLSFYRYGAPKKPSLEFLDKLIELDSDVTVTDEEGNGVMHYVLFSMSRLAAPEHIPFVEKLLRAGADPNKPNATGEPPLFWYNKVRTSIPGGDEELLQMLVEAGMNLNCRNGKGQPFLCNLASRWHNTEETVKKFVRLGADINVADADGETIIHTMIRGTPSLSSIQWMCEAGARLDTCDRRGNTPLHTMVSKSDYIADEEEIIRLLAETSLPLAKNSKGQTVLHVVTSSARLQLMLSMDVFKELDINERDLDGRTPLHHAVKLRFESSMISEILGAGADAMVLDTSGLSPLHVAAKEGHAENSTVLLAWYEDRGVVETYINQLGDGRAPLHYACAKGSSRCVWSLLQCRANAQALDDQGRTPLLALAEARPSRELPMPYAAEIANIVGLLKHSGVDLSAPVTVQAEADEGKARLLTPLDMAFEWKNWDLVRRLVDHGVELPTAYREDKAFISSTTRELSSAEKLEADGLAGWDEVLRRGSYGSILKHICLGGKWDWSTHAATLNGLVQRGYLDALDRIGEEVKRTGAPDWIKADKPRCRELLRLACQSAFPPLKILQVLVEKFGLDINTDEPDSSENSALHILAEGDSLWPDSLWHKEVLEYCLSKGANIEARNHHGDTPLIIAVSHGNEAAVRIMLRHGADANATRLHDADGRPVLEYAPKAGIMKALLEHGAKTRPGQLARNIRERLDPDMIQLLLQARLDPNELPISPPEQGGNEPEARYALHEAAQRRQPSCGAERKDIERQRAAIDMLLAHGANPLASYPDGSSLLQRVIEDRGIFDSFMPFLAELDVNAKGRDGRTLLISACVPPVPANSRADDTDTNDTEQDGTPVIMVEIVKPLLDAQTDVLITDDAGRTALHWFCMFPGEFDDAHRQAFNALVEQEPAAVQLADKEGRKPIHLALMAYRDRAQQSTFAIKCLQSAGADLSEPDPVTGDSVLHMIAPRLVGKVVEAAEAASFFHEMTALVDINVRNMAGETPCFSLMAACAGTCHSTLHSTRATADDVTHAAALDILTDRGAELALTDGRGRTLLHVTASRELSNDASDWQDLTETFRKLMKLGLDPRKEDNDLRSAIDVADARRLHGVLQLFSIGEDAEGAIMDVDLAGRASDSFLTPDNGETVELVHESHARTLGREHHSNANEAKEQKLTERIPAGFWCGELQLPLGDCLVLISMSCVFGMAAGLVDTKWWSTYAYDRYPTHLGEELACESAVVVEMEIGEPGRAVRPS